MRIGIIGAGISGLSAAWWLSRRGHDVVIFESASEVGGLISTFDFDGLRVDRFYHFLCLQDRGYFRLCDELGIGEKIRFARARTGFFYQGREYGFTTPLDLLRFSPIPLVERLRFGVFALEARWRREWRQLDELAARPWVIDRIGRRAYEVIWHPLLALKFGRLHERISAAWVWHRLHRVARSKGRHGFLEGGTALLLDTLVEALAERGVEIHCSHAVQGIQVRDGRVAGLSFAGGGSRDFDRVVSTLPLPVLAGLLPAEWKSYADELRAVEYLGVVCVVQKLARPLSRYFWYNIHDDQVPFNGLIEFTNLSPSRHEKAHIVYAPYYVATDEPLYRMEDEQVFRQSWEATKRISPRLRDEDLLGWRVFRAPYAQAVCPTNFLRLLPSQRAPIEGLHLLDSAFLYPEDRSQSGLILKALERSDDVAS